ncbi:MULTISPECIES: ABC transporter substrate-binding protein/permease [Lactobacillus]|uniref:Transporter substrate-binding domain-containing protein n=1 Tax=Lactobacillus xujianguonis TaxID=2495899 RepID=A0A437SVU6_9LACO|nr:MULTISPECIES: ABC transporter substrate-binding protein/permease [Lactobacillus]RVU71054.1 transporter substrate-binding domain-containing protein [Lactobacillus xujianguonis]RVU76790.1 transporter substrate-binding domain-containing protein [Lactobacillus xujianguonis]
MKKSKIGAIVMALVIMFSTLFSYNSVTYAANTEKKVAEGTVLKKIKTSKELVVGTSADYPPLEFTASENGKTKYVGVDIELAKDIAKDLHAKLVIKNMSFDSLLVALETGKVDMVISAMTPTPERKKSVAFSKIYYRPSGEYFLINKRDRNKYKNIKNFKGQTLGAQTGSIQYNLIQKQMKGSKVKGLGKINNLVLALQSGKVAGVVVEELIAKAYAQNNPSLLAVRSDLKEDQAGNAIAIAKGQNDLVAQVNKTINQVKKQHLIDKKYLPEAAKYMKTANKNNTMMKYAPYFVKGVWYTIVITIFSVLIGVILGTILALMRLSKIKLVHWLAVCYIEFVRGTPQMVQILFIYFGVGYLISNLSAVMAGIIAIGLNSGAYVAEDIRSGINSIAKGQTEAARSLGLSQAKTYRYVVIPQALKNIWPALGNEFITLLKDSSLVSVIGVSELMYQTQLIQTSTYRGVLPLFIAMIIYFIMTFTLSRILNHFEKRMKHND